MQSGDLLGDRFRLGPHLDRSRRGEMWLAQDEQGGRPCEVELLRASGFEGEALQQLAEREVEVGRRLADVPGLLRALATGPAGDGGWWFIARDVEEGAFPLPLGGGLRRRIEALAAAARLVDRLHQARAVHRDLAPTTILVAADGTPRLAGLALARVEGLPDPPAAPCGLPFTGVLSAAPELFDPPLRADVRSDVYSLGALLFRAAAGSWPYPGPGLPQVVRQHERVRQEGALPPRARTFEPALPPKLDAACFDALAIDPVRRMPNAAAFAEALEAWLATAPTEPAAPELAFLPRTDRLDPARAMTRAARRLDDGGEEDTRDFPGPSGPSAPDHDTVGSFSAAAAPPAPPPVPAVAGAPASAYPELVGLPGGTLVLRVPPKGLDPLVRALWNLDPQGATRLLLDMTDCEQLGGQQLESLTELLTVCEKKGLDGAMFALRPRTRMLLAILNLDAVLPRILDAQEPFAAVAELRSTQRA